MQVPVLYSSGLVGMFDWRVSGSKLVEHRGDPKSPPHVSQNMNLVCEKKFIFKFVKNYLKFFFWVGGKFHVGFYWSSQSLPPGFKKALRF